VANFDKFGRDYDQLLSRQKEELAHWKRLLQPEIYDALAGWCEMTNGPAELTEVKSRGPYKAGGLHSCPVNAELHHFLMGFQRKGQPFGKIKLESEQNAELL
jgi:hypothetical protein